MAGGLSNILTKYPHLKVYADVIDERFNAIEIDRVLVYLVDIVDESALYHLASQFDVLGYKGWFLANSEADRRELIKKAIYLHRYKGTPFAVKEAIKSLGFADAIIYERITGYTKQYDGEIYHNGIYNYGGNYHWAIFRVVVDPTTYPGPITSQVVTAMLALIKEYKAARCHLLDLTFGLSVTETVEVTEDFDVSVINTVISGFDYTLDFPID